MVRPARPFSRHIPGVRFWLTSFLFWIGLGVSAILMGGLVLTPRWLDVERQHQRYARNAQKLRTLEQEVSHLTLVAKALRTDPDYLARVATSELQALPAGQKLIPLEDSLEDDLRVPVPASAPAEPVPVYLSILEVVATSGSIRNRLASAAAILILTTFLCFNESFLNGGLAGALKFLRTELKRRYATGPASVRLPCFSTVSDEENGGDERVLSSSENLQRGVHSWPPRS